MSAGELDALLLSALVGLGAVALALPPAVVLAYVVARGTFRGRTLLDGVLLLPLVLPPVVTGYGLLLLVGRGGVFGSLLEAWGIDIAFTWRAAVLAAAVVSFPLAYRACRIGFESVDPRLESVARTLGAGRFDAFASIALPLARRSIVAGAVLAFARSVGEFGATIVLAGDIPGETRTLPIAVYGVLRSPGSLTDAWRLAALAVILSIGALVVGERLARRERVS